MPGITLPPWPEQEFRDLQKKVDELERRNGALVHIIREMKRYKLIGELTNPRNRIDMVESAGRHIKDEVRQILEQEA